MNQKNLGFTLVELLVVISIIGILSALLLVNFVGIRGRAADSKKKAELTELKKALQAYYNDYQNYPTEDDMPLEDDFTVEDVTYMKKLPEDFTYTVDTDLENYLLSVELENASDENIEENAEYCEQDYEAGDNIFYLCND